MAQVFDSERKSRAEVVSVIEEYFVKLDKEPDKGVGVLSELCDLLKIKPKVKVDPTLLRINKDFKISKNIAESPSSGKWDSERFHERDIIDATIRSVLTGSRLCGYLEGRNDIRGFYPRRALLSCTKSNVI